MLTHQQTTILENAWEILDKLRNCRDFNNSHDLTVGDACAVLSDFLDWSYEREAERQPLADRQNNQQPLPPVVSVVSLEAFNNL